MHKLFVGLVVAAMAAASAIAAQETETIAAVQQFVDGFNKGDVNAMQSACVDDAAIIDDFPPHSWRGAGATAKWFNDFQAFAKNNDLTNPIVSLDKARHNEVTGDNAYVVVPTHFMFEKKGKPVTESGTMTLTLHKAEAGWKITAWAWADG